MSLLNLKTKVKSTKKRVGRGNASGHGTYSTRGMKGQTARAGGRRRPGFEGGQTPYIRRMPKLKGFKNPNHIDYQAVNVGQLNVFEENATVDAAALYQKNLISKKNQPVKLLGGRGELEKALTIIVNKASNSASEKVKAKKGTLKLLSESVPKSTPKAEATIPSSPKEDEK